MASGVRSGGRHARGKGLGQHGRGLVSASLLPARGRDGAGSGPLSRSHARSGGGASVVRRQTKKTRIDAWLPAAEMTARGPREGCAPSSLCLYHPRSYPRAAESS
jgi:hypothetical protein